MGQPQRPHLKLFSVRCTLLAFHAMVWSFLWYSTPEFRQTSDRSDEFVDKQLQIVGIVGAVFLGGIAIMTISGLTIYSIPIHYVFIVAHALGIILTFVSIFNYWDVMLLWIPCVLTTICPFLIEVINAVLIAANKSQHY